MLFQQETSRILGCAFEVHNYMGHGLKEKIYENALVVEFRLQDISYAQQHQFPVLYKGHNIGIFVPDLIVFDSVIVDTKVIPELTGNETGQMLNYLKITGLKVGLLINFKKPRLEWKRVAL